MVCEYMYECVYMCVSIIDVSIFHLETIGGKLKLNIVDFGGQRTRSKRKFKY